MAQNLIRKSGIPVLACTSSDLTSALACTLLIKFHNDNKQATISLQSSVSILDFEDEQNFTLIYNADNLVHGANSLKPAITSLSQAQLGQIARHGDLQLATLCLTIKNPCPLWCPATSRSIAAKDGYETTFHQLVKLARATAIHIMFDLQWLQLDNQERLQSFIKEPEMFTGFPTDQKNTKYRLADCSVFSSVEDVPSEAPPAYAEASNKRPRTKSPSSTGLPPSKRLLQSATPTSTPFPAQTTTAESTLSPPLAPIPEANAPDIQRSVEATVKKLLPDTLKKILLDMLPQLFAGSQPSPSYVPTVASPHGQQIPIPKSTPYLGSIITDQVAARIDAHLQNICDDILEHALSLRSTADDEFLDAIHDHKLDMSTIKEDSTRDLQQEIDEKLATFRADAAEIVEEAGEQAEQICRDVCAKLDNMAEETTKRLKLDSQILGLSERHMQVEKLQEPERRTIGERTQRAKTAPL